MNGSPGPIGYLGLGSNVGDRLAHLRAAVAGLATHGVAVLRSSSVYETQPVGEVLKQRSFYNACLQVSTSLDPEELLDACKAVEREVGRTGSAVRHGPREIDVDVLLLDGVSHRSERLALPHPSVTERRFVLVPLLELEPGLRLPDGTRLVQALQALGPDGQEVRRAGAPLR